MAVVGAATADEKDKGDPTPTKTIDVKDTETPEPKATQTPDLKPTETKEPKATATPAPTKQPPPGDTDGDRCPDGSESGPDEYQGGRRDYVNPWDYFNPTKDGENRVDDVVIVVEHYFLAEGDPGYSEDFDRSYLGPNGWNLGPPEGQVLVDDVVYALHSYFHDCGNGDEK